MKEQKIIWTVLPNGIDKPNTAEAGLKFSVFVSPRLYLPDTAPERLDEFPNFLNWPGKVANMQFEVELNNGDKLTVTPDTSEFKPGLWSALFKNDTYVRPFAFRDMKERAIRTYPVQGISSYIKDKYISIAENSPGSLPLLTRRIDDYGKPIGDPNSTLESVIDDLGELLKPEKTVICPIGPNEYGDFIERLYAENLDQVTKKIVDDLMPCISKGGFKLQEEKTKISREDKNLWIITDGKNRFFLEDTGTALNLFVYASIYTKIDQELQDARVLDPAKLYGYKEEELNFLQANRFYNREEEDNPYLFKPNAMQMSEPIEKPEIDFHQMHSTLGDHPTLMRELALVLDFIIPVPEEPFSKICVRPVWNVEDLPSTFNNDQTTTWTRCISSDNTFTAQPEAGSNIKERMLDLTGANDEHAGSNTVYDLIQIDPDGASLQMLNTANSLKRQIKRRYLHTELKFDPKTLIVDCMPKIAMLNRILENVSESTAFISENAQVTKIGSNTWIINDNGETLELELTDKSSLHIFRKMKVAYDTPDDAGLPSLRSAGIALTKSGRAYELNTRLNDSFKINEDFEDRNVDEISLYADELVRGYRVDILNESTDIPEWRSLCEREGTYYFPGTGAKDEEVKDEGYVKGGSTTSGDAGDSDLYFHETVFRWNGWSLCAQRPGKSIITIPHEPEIIDLFTWGDIPGDNQELIDFLVNIHNYRWAKDASITKPNDKIIVKGSDNEVTITLYGNGGVGVQPEYGDEFKYSSRSEGTKTIVYTTRYTQDEVPGVVGNEAATEFKLESYFNAKPGSLPKLRFGHSYKLRARIVDLAGNSLKLETPDGSFTSNSVFYMRFEPLSPPTLVPRAQFTEGESLERMVVRSNFDQTEAQYVASEKVQNAIKDKDLQYTEGNERHVVPPKTSQLTAETHGEFDDHIGKDKDYKAGYNIAKKEKGTLYDEGIVDTNTGEKNDLTYKNDILKVPPIPDGESTEDHPGQYVIHKEEDMELPYLPDPISRGASFSKLPGIDYYTDSNPVRISNHTLGLNALKIPFNLDWPNSTPFRIRIEERQGKMSDGKCEETFNNPEQPKWINDILTLYLGKAQETTIRYSCYFNEEDLEKMGMWKWLKNSLKNNDLKKYALAGCHWMLTPYRELTLVHAVQQPLCEPEFSLLYSLKAKIGDTFSHIEGEVHLNSSSTEKIDLLAQWTEPVDDLADPGPGTIDVNASAFELKIAKSDPNNILLPVKSCIDHRHEFGDTKYRHIKYYLVGTSRFREYFNPKLTEAGATCIDWDKVPGDDSEMLITLINKNRLSKFTPAGANITKGSDKNKITVDEGGTSVILTLNEEKNALLLSDNGKEYIYAITLKGDWELCINEDLITRRGPVYETDVLNSARPLSPKLQYAIPTFGWEEKRFPGGKKKWKSIERKRIGGGLRLYLDRPWFSSGDGELLGIVLYPHPIHEELKLKPYVTQWGMDPIRKSKIPKGILRTNDFVGFEKFQKTLTLEEKETTSLKFDVVGYKPEYNNDRKLWFCDIQFDPEEVISYFPFVRLALAAYQPNSIPNAHLSRVIQTDFLQLANDRTLKVDLLDDSGFKINVSGYAPAGDENNCSNRMEVTIEELPEGAHEEFGWVAVKGNRRQPNPYTLPTSSLDAAKYLWEWEAKLKLPVSRKKNRLRIVVKEFESYEADGLPIILPLTFYSYIGQHDTIEVERLVYMDIVEINPMDIIM